MNYIVVDFEMTPISVQEREEQKLCSHNEIIEFGAVMLNDSFELVSELNRYVKPMYGDVTRRIEDLTKITNEKLSGALSFCEAYREFAEWCCQSDEFEIYAWSEADKLQLTNECTDKLTENDDNETLSLILKSWKDLQQIFAHALATKKRYSLSNALTMLGIEFSGNAHNAFFDAKNTAEILKIYLKDGEEGFKHIVDSVQAELDRAAHLTYSLESMLMSFFDDDVCSESVASLGSSD